ncbi:MAG TPA: MFS transporter [Syntrophorhabdaceae bacterium]|nr:MFS transporter [Syntrophorhabdaceae bacterium]
MASKEIAVGKVFDSISKTSSYQIWVCFLCFLVTTLDGFDLIMIGVATPKIVEFLHITMQAFGLAMGLVIFGPLLGALVFGMPADRIGRKWMLIASALVFGAATLLTAFITNVGQLAVLRFFTGLGAGGAIPTALAFGSEYAPTRLRKTFVAAMYAGMPVGGTLGGLVAAYCIPHYGWQSLFIFGGAVPVVVAVMAMVFLPESLEFLAIKGTNDERIRKTFAKVAPAIAADKEYHFLPSEKKLPGVPIKHLFMEGRASVTILFWLILLGSLYILSLVVAWAPSLLHKSGASVVQYSIAFACFNFGSVVATFIIGRMMDKSNPFRLLEVLFVCSFFSLVIFGIFSRSSFATVTATSILCGLFVAGAFSGLLALVTVSYPPYMRGTAVSWAYALARIGSVLANVIGGYLITVGWSVTRICSTNAVVGLIVALLIIFLQKRLAAQAAWSSGKGA